MIRHTATRTVRATRELVKQFSTMRGSPGERRLKRRHVKALRAIFNDGLFHSPVWATARCLENGVTYRVDGQHSSTMLAAVEHELPASMSVVIKEFECDDLKDLAQVFAQFDNPISTRTRSELAKCHGAVHPELNDVSEASLYSCVMGMAYAHREGHEDLVDPEMKSRLIHDNVGFILWVHQWAITRLFSRKGVMAAMYDTFLIDPKMADRFWQLTRDESDPNPNHPTRVYRKLLGESLAGRNDPKFKRIASHRALYAKGIYAWNAWCEGRTTDLKYRDDRDILDLASPNLLKIDGDDSVSDISPIIHDPPPIMQKSESDTKAA